MNNEAKGDVLREAIVSVRTALALLDDAELGVAAAPALDHGAYLLQQELNGLAKPVSPESSSDSE